MKTTVLAEKHRYSSRKVSRRTIAMALIEIGRRQRAGEMPTSDGHFIHGSSEGKRFAHFLHA